MIGCIKNPRSNALLTNHFLLCDLLFFSTTYLRSVKINKTLIEFSKTNKNDISAWGSIFFSKT